MAVGVNIPIAADAGGVISEAKKVEDAFERVIDSVDEIADESRDAGRDTGRNLEKIAREADDSADKLERKFRDAFDKVKAESKTASKHVSDDVKGGADKGSEAVSEFKDEAKQNFSEVASSFTGDMDSAIDLVQGTLGGLAGSIPGVGLALGGLGAAAGVFYNQWQENTERTKEAFSSMYADMKESGRDFLSENFIQSEVDKIITGADGAARSFQSAQWDASLAGVEISTVLRAWAGDAAAVAEVQAGVAAALAENAEKSKDVAKAAKEAGIGVGSMKTALAVEEQGLGDLSKALDANTENRTKATAAAEAGRATLKANAETTRAAADAESSYRDALADSSKAIAENGKGHEANKQAVLDSISAALDYTDALKDNGAGASEVEDAQRAMYAQLVDLAEQSGLTEAKARDLINTFVDFPADIETGVVLDDANAKARLKAIEDGNYTVRVKAVLDDPDLLFNQIRNSLNGRSVGVNVKPRNGVSVP